jgi:hypothetical protein
MSSFAIVGKSPARSTDPKNVYYVTKIGAGSYGIWNRAKSTKTASQMARELEAGTEGTLVINSPRPFSPEDSVSTTLAEAFSMADYNAPDNY